LPSLAANELVQKIAITKNAGEKAPAEPNADEKIDQFRYQRDCLGAISVRDQAHQYLIDANSRNDGNIHAGDAEKIEQMFFQFFGHSF
jgi:hypothetical protein